VIDPCLTKPCWHDDIREQHKCCKWEVIMSSNVLGIADNSSIVLKIHLRTLCVEWNNLIILPDSMTNWKWDRQMKKLKNGFTKVSNLHRHTGGHTGQQAKTLVRHAFETFKKLSSVILLKKNHLFCFFKSFLLWNAPCITSVFC